MPISDIDDTDTDIDNDEIPMRYQSREARSENKLYYLREPPADPPNTTFNGAIQNTSRKIFYTTSASLPADRPRCDMNSSTTEVI